MMSTGYSFILLHFIDPDKEQHVDLANANSETSARHNFSLSPRIEKTVASG
jgi:hypothetical protein